MEDGMSVASRIEETARRRAIEICREPMHDFKDALLEPTVLAEALKDKPVTRFLVLRGLVGTFDATSAADEPSAEYECTREARLLLARSLTFCGASDGTAAAIELTADTRGGWRFTPDVLVAHGRRALIGYDCMNSVASHLPDLVHCESARDVQGTFARGGRRRIPLWELTRDLLGSRASERELFGDAYEPLARYVGLVHTLGNFAPIPFGHPNQDGAEHARSYNEWKGTAPGLHDRQDAFLRALRDGWETLPWELAGGNGESSQPVPCSEVMSFRAYIRAAQLELYCVDDEAVGNFLHAARAAHEAADAHGVIAAYACIEKACAGEPVSLGADALSYIRAASARIEARGLLIAARARAELTSG